MDDGHSPEPPAVGPKLAYENRVLAYVDILGWRELIKRSAKDPSVLLEIEGAVEALGDTEGFVHSLKKRAIEVGQEALSPEVTIFSDNVALSCPPDNRSVSILVSQVQMFSTRLMVEGLWTRGAIVRGDLYHRGSVILGPALVDAYMRESSIAKYPRIIVADDLRPDALAALAPESVTVGAEAILEDRDGFAILNHFRGGLTAFDLRFIAHVRERAAKELQKHFDDLQIRSKLAWMLRYLDDVAAIARTS